MYKNNIFRIICGAIIDTEKGKLKIRSYNKELKKKTGVPWITTNYVKVKKLSGMDNLHIGR